MRPLHLTLVAALAHLAALRRYALASEQQLSASAPRADTQTQAQSQADLDSDSAAYSSAAALSGYAGAQEATNGSAEVMELSLLEAARLGYFTHSPAVSVTISVAYTLVFIVGIVGNSFVVAIVCKSPRMRTVTNFFIANLALADILVLVFCLPATLVSNLFIRKYPPARPHRS